MKQAEQDGAVFVERGKKALEQAARDTVLYVGDALAAALKEMVGREVRESMDSDALKQMLVKVVEAYCLRESGSARIEVFLKPGQQREIVDFLMTKYGESLRKGVEIRGDEEVVSGFRVSVVNEEVEHDFTSDAIVEALCRLLRPHLAAIVRNRGGNEPEAPVADA